MSQYMRIDRDVVEYRYLGDGGSMSLITKRTPAEVEEEIAELEWLKHKVRKINNLGDVNLDIINSEIEFLKTGNADRPGGSLAWACSSANINDWLTDRGEDSMSELWKMSALDIT